MGQAFTMYTSENKMMLPANTWFTKTDPSISWHGYWIGMLADYKVPTGTVICPDAQDPILFNVTTQSNGKGFGLVHNAWTGQFQTKGTGVLGDGNVVRNDTNDQIIFKGKKAWGYRVGSYGMNSNCAFGNSFGTKMNQLKPSSEVPLFFDSVWVDVTEVQNPLDPHPAHPYQAPADLSGLSAAGTVNADQQQNRFLIARHGRGINICMADGSAKYVLLPDTFQYQWTPTFIRATLQTPKDLPLN